MSDSGKLRQQIASFDFAGALLDGNWNNPVRSEFRRTIHDRELLFSPIAEVGGVVAVEVTDPASGEPVVISPQAGSLRKSVDIEVAKEIHQHILIFLNAERTQAVWHLSKVVQGKRLHREYRLDKTTPLEPLAKILRGMDVKYEWLDPTGELSHTIALDMMDQAGLYAEKVSKKFYDLLAKQRKTFEPFLKWIADEEKRAWYITALLNRLMFIYFLQHRGLLGEGTSYLARKLQECKPKGTDCFYREFFLPLCFFGFGKPEGQRGPFEDTFKGVPYLNGGIFSVHQVEAENGVTAEAVWEGKLPTHELVPDSEFKRWFGFFDSWRWTLAEEEKDKDGHIHPDILGYIFEKYINAFQPGGQKGSGAYYSKEDITGYICRNTIIPRLFDMLAEAGGKGKKAVNPLPIGPHPNLLNDGKGISQGEGIDRYIYDAVKTTEYLPTETEREFDARQKRYESILQGFDDGEIATVNDFITYNLDIEQMALDFASTIQDAMVLSDFYFKCLKKITVLDPTCGSGAFLFAALKILYPLYEACLLRMANLVAIGSQGKTGGGRTWKDEFAFINEVSAQQTFIDQNTATDEAVLSQFRRELDEIGHHPRSYYIHKTIIVNNLFGVDIMEEAVEICKLRLFLKLIAHADIDESKPNDGIEPLPDIDFNILAGNTLIGYTSFEDIDRTWAATGNLPWDKNLTELRIWVGQYKDELRMFRECQLGIRPESVVTKESLSRTHARAKAELDEDVWHLYRTTGNIKDKTPQRQFISSHQPFHWFLEFPTVLPARQDCGFDAIIGNLPYVEYCRVRNDYTVKGCRTERSGNLYAYVMERSINLLKHTGRCGMIVPLSAYCTDRMEEYQQVQLSVCDNLWLSHYAERPSKLFEGVERNLSICLFDKKVNASPTIWSTSYIKWHSESRPVVFESLSYIDATETKVYGIVPKVGTRLEVSLLTRLQQVRRTLRFSAQTRKAPHILYYRNSGGRYWKIITDFQPEFYLNGQRDVSSRETYLYFVTPEDLKLAVAALSSNLYYWFYVMNSDARTNNPSDLLGFPLDCGSLSDTTTRQLCRLCDELMADYKRNSIMQDGRYQTGAVKFQQFYPAKSKSMIDEIDRVLAKHYGFTEEELDFIINYDIKYRMGKDAEASE